MNLENTIAAMMTENTGTHMLDSGGAYGRNWQLNAHKTLDDFKARPSATLEIYYSERDGTPSVELIPTVDVFHKLTSGVIYLDDLCNEFNAMPVDDWHGDQLGVSRAGSEWLELHGFEYDDRSDFNTYNWDNNFSQVLQGAFVKLHGDELYVLLQIHGGADVRGGYTDAKLFKLHKHAEEYNLYCDDCGFSAEIPDIDTQTVDMFTGDTRDNHINVNWHGEWINSDGGCLDDDDALAFATAAGANADNNTVTIDGDGFFDI
jgi:hypothetical protein